MTANKPTQELTQTANTAFEVDLTSPSNGALTDTSVTALTYTNATTEEKVEMEKIMEGINLLDPETIIALGSEQRKKLGELSDQILDNIKPELKLAFANALKELMEAIGSNSIDEMKKRLSGGALAQLGDKFMSFFEGKDADKKKAEEMIESFMTDISSSRKTISELTDNLEEQVIQLNNNYANINTMGKALVKTAQEMRLVRAAAAEKIRRIETGEDKILVDLADKAKASGRPDDMDNLNTAQANWNNLRKADAGLLGSVNVYEMNTANLAFTKQANLQNRLDTEMALANTVNEWKSQLAIFAMVTSETAAATLLNDVDKITAQSVQKNQDMFDTLVDLTIARSATGPYNLRQLIDAQAHMVQKLADVSEKVEANFASLAQDKKALEESSRHFKASMIDSFSKNGGNILATKPPAPQGI